MKGQKLMGPKIIRDLEQSRLIRTEPNANTCARSDN